MNKTTNIATDNRDGRIVPENVPETNVCKINGRTPDEIKKGLEVCSTGDGCIQCPYDEPNLCHGIENKADALAYIQQIETDNESKQKRIDELESRLAQAERERDAMHRDMKLYSRCNACKKFADGQYCPVHTECTYGGKALFVWRGVCEENTKEDGTNAC